MPLTTAADRQAIRETPLPSHQTRRCNERRCCEDVADAAVDAAVGMWVSALSDTALCFLLGEVCASLSTVAEVYGVAVGPTGIRWVPGV